MMGQSRLMSLQKTLAEIVGAAHVLTEPQDTAPYFTDWRKQYSAPAECVTLDGLFIALDMLHVGDLRFDERYRFHFYDLDLCVTAFRKGLALGTADIMLSHQSLGDITTETYASSTRQFRQKWQAPVSVSVFPRSSSN